MDPGEVRGADVEQVEDQCCGAHLHESESGCSKEGERYLIRDMSVGSI